MKFMMGMLTLAGLFLAGSAAAECVNVTDVNLRKGPGLQHEKSWRVYRYMPFKVIGQKGEWRQVRDLDGETHWIFNKLLTDQFTCAVVKAKLVNVRSGPGAQHEATLLGQVEKYYAFKVITEQDHWVEVEDEMENRGWVSKSLVWMH